MGVEMESIANEIFYLKILYTNTQIVGSTAGRVVQVYVNGMHNGWIFIGLCHMYDFYRIYAKIFLFT